MFFVHLCIPVAKNSQLSGLDCFVSIFSNNVSCYCIISWIGGNPNSNSTFGRGRHISGWQYFYGWHRGGPRPEWYTFSVPNQTGYACCWGRTGTQKLMCASLLLAFLFVFQPFQHVFSLFQIRLSDFCASVLKGDEFYIISHYCIWRNKWVYTFQGVGHT